MEEDEEEAVNTTLELNQLCHLHQHVACDNLSPTPKITAGQKQFSGHLHSMSLIVFCYVEC